ncbi:MAG TPA: LytTR family DNA-binding domain-containing protein [Bacteroidales bacterium]|jgi:two-component system LytT family response regulator|nr:LytTR family DNA-binding domain-containing protein [Bacteroidales bacterium]HQM70498.1 LytTR family DNA-binding domain-containing protein [Bacteroidales bacterium]
MNVIIVDDEATVRNAIRALLNEHFPEVNILATAGSIEEGYEAIRQNNPDLIFLDIELPDGTGFGLLKKFSTVSFKVIFVTGHQEYALDAIKVSALDYVLKPVDTDELCKAVEKAREIINQADQQLKLQALSENLQSRKVLKRIILHTSDHLQLVSISEIIRAEADSNYTSFNLSGGKRILVSRTIKEFESLLSGSGMIRVHQSHLVNIAFIDRFVKKDGGYLILKDGSKIPVSPNLKKQVLKAMTEHLYE